MTWILRNLPVLEKSTPVRFGDRHVTFLPDQILLWVRIREKGSPAPDPHMSCFLALLDTGNNFDCTASDRHIGKPLVLTVKLPACPSTKVALAALVKAGAWSTVRVKVCVVCEPGALPATTVKV